MRLVDQDAVILEDNEIAISRDLLVTDELFTNNIDLTNLRLVDQDAVILDSDQKAVSKDAVVLQDGQVAISPDRVVPDGFKSVPEDALLLEPNQLAIDNNQQVLQPDQKAVPIDSTEGKSNSAASGRFQNPPTIFDQPGPGVDSAGNSDIAALKLGDDAPGIGNGDGDGDGAGSSDSSGSGVVFP